MPPEVVPAAASAGIAGTIEWELLSQLRECSRRLVGREPHRTHPARGTRIQELWTALRELDIQIRTTLTTLRLDLLLQSDLESDDPEQYYDSDDSGASFTTARSNQERFRLPELCLLLESRANTLLAPPEDTIPSPRIAAYPRLARLVAYLTSPATTARHAFIPLPEATAAPFLFNVADRHRLELAEAFVELCGSSPGRRPPKELRKQMLAEVVELKKQILAFNNSVNTLQVSLGSLDILASRPPTSDPSTTPTSAPPADSPLAPFAAFQGFRQQTAMALHAISSHFRSCGSVKLKSASHRFFLQLPGWEEVSDRRHATKDTAAVRLFLTGCSHGDWQHASVRLLRSDDPVQCRPGKPWLCKALTSAYDDDRDLEFYVSGAHMSIGGESDMVPIHIPVVHSSDRKYGDRSPGKDSLSTLIGNDCFAREPTIALVNFAGDDAAVWSIEHRQALAVKLVLGLMLSMDSDHAITTWDLEKIRFLEPLDAEYTPFIMIDWDQLKATASWRGCLSFSNMAPLVDSSGDGDGAGDSKPLLPFTLLAKALAEIAGQRMGCFQLPSTYSGEALNKFWKKLRRALEGYTKLVTRRGEFDDKTFSFLLAARNCLEFHMHYSARTISAQGKSRLEIAWELVFDAILTKIDSSLDLGTCAAQAAGAEGTAQLALLDRSRRVAPPFSPSATKLEGPIVTAQPEVVLFDGLDIAEKSREAQNADVFFKKLDAFHNSYSRFIESYAVSATLGKERPRRIRVAILDTGIDFLHPGIRAAKANGRIRKEWCFSWVGAEADVTDEDDEMHGSNCASLIHEVAPEADIYIGKVFQRNGFRTYQAENIPKAIYHAAETWKADIISMSFGLRRPPDRKDRNRQAERAALEQYGVLIQDIETAIKAASPRVMFAAASNDGKNGSRTFPATFAPWVIAVHASDGEGGDGGINPPTEVGPNFMTLGMGLKLMRKEMEEKETTSGGSTQKYKAVRRCGTSFATPIAAGLAATVMDLSLCVGEITERTSDQLQESVEMAKMLRLMSTPQNDDFAGYYYVAPWNLWAPSWQADDVLRRSIWDKINLRFRGY